MPTNPYRSGSWFPDLSPTINSFVDNLTRLKMHQDDVDFRGRQLQQGQDQFNTQQFGTSTPTPGMATIPQQQLVETQRGRATAEESNKLARDRFLAENPHMADWNESNLMKLTSNLITMGVPVEDIPFLTTDLKIAAADKNVKRGDIANISEMKWPEWTAQAADALSKKVENLSKQAADLPEDDLKRQEIMGQIKKRIKAMQMMESIPADKVKQTLFPDIYQYEQNQKAATQKAGMDQVKAFIATKALRGEPLTGDEKAMVGIKPERPSSVAPGGTLVDPGTGKVVYTNPNRPEPNRPVSVAPGGTLVDPRSGALIYTAPNKPDKGITETELRAQRKELADNESKLLLNKDKEGAGPLADLHNERSEKPYAYQWKPNKYLTGGEYVKITLPKIKGKQVTAKDVFDTASQRGMTYDDVLKAIGVR